MPVRDSVQELASLIGDPRRGLPEPVFRFVSGVTPLVSVDLLIRNAVQHTLLTWRDDEYYRGWHVPGGIVRFKERMADRVAAVARTELGTDVALKGGPVAVNEIMHPTRDARGHFISFLYECDLTGALAEDRRFAQGRPKHGEWAWHGECPPELIPQHQVYRGFIGGQGAGA